MTQFVKIHPLAPDSTKIWEAAFCIQREGVVVFPTETLYALGVNAFNEKAIKKAFQIKGRNYDKPLPILIDKKEDVRTLVYNIHEKAECLMEVFWPGGLTIVFKASSKLPLLLTGNTGKIGIRISKNAIAQALVKETGSPITATSANMSGQKGATNPLEIYENLGSKVDLIIDAGSTKGCLGSTIVDATLSPMKIIREGVIASNVIEPYL